MSAAIIIPAHDEEVALRRCLIALALQTHTGPLEIIVVPNGCSDRTADVAREFGELLSPGISLRVVELEAAAKWRALNAGDAATDADCRIYLDADIALSPGAVEALLGALAAPGARLVQPEPEIEPGKKRYAVRGFIRVWSGLPYVRRQVLGLGCYAVNRAGRRRWGAFPPLGADDTYVRFRFEAAEKQVVREARMTLSFPSSLRELVLVRARWCRLSRNVREGEDRLPPDERRRWPAAVRFISIRPWLWADALMFASIWACAVVVSLRPRAEDEWARATTSGIRTSGGSREAVTAAGSARPASTSRRGAPAERVS